MDGRAAEGEPSLVDEAHGRSSPTVMGAAYAPTVSNFNNIKSQTLARPLFATGAAGRYRATHGLAGAPLLEGETRPGVVTHSVVSTGQTRLTMWVSRLFPGEKRGWTVDVYNDKVSQAALCGSDKPGDVIRGAKSTRTDVVHDRESSHQAGHPVLPSRVNTTSNPESVVRDSVHTGVDTRHFKTRLVVSGRFDNGSLGLPGDPGMWQINDATRSMESYRAPLGCQFGYRGDDQTGATVGGSTQAEHLPYVDNGVDTRFFGRNHALERDFDTFRALRIFEDIGLTASDLLMIFNAIRESGLLTEENHWTQIQESHVHHDVETEDSRESSAGNDESAASMQGRGNYASEDSFLPGVGERVYDENGPVSTGNRIIFTD